MDFFQKMGLVALLLLWPLTINAQINSVQVTEQTNTTTNTVSYTLHNTGNTALNLHFIIIQDEVLLLEQGEVILEAGGTSLITVGVECAVSHDFELEISEAIIPKNE